MGMLRQLSRIVKDCQGLSRIVVIHSWDTQAAQVLRPIASYQLPVTSYQLPVASYHRAGGYLPPR